MKNRKLNRKRVLLFFIICMLFFMEFLPIQTPGKSRKDRIKDTIDLLFRQKRYDAAEACCRQLLGKHQNYCHRCLGDAFFKIGDYKMAGEYYRRCGYTGGQLRIIDVYLEMEAYETALAYCKNLRLTDPEARRQVYHRMGIAHFTLGNVEKAIEYYEEAMPSAQRATAYEHRAEAYCRQGNKNTAKTYYIKAVRDYEFLLKHFFYEWRNEYMNSLRRCVAQRDRFEKTAAEKAKQALLGRVLEGAGEYCEKLNKSAFHFFCHENINELLNLGSPVNRKNTSWRQRTGTMPLPPIENRYIYEYQLIKEMDKIQEMRTLIKKNGFKVNEPDAQLRTQLNKYEKLLFGPIALLSKFWQERYSYKILGEEKLWGEDTVVIEAVPLHLYRENHLFGSIWIGKGDFTVLKIQWNPKSIGLSQQIENIARAMDFTPDVTFFAEFKEKKRGIRFPSRYFLEEAYRDKKGKKYVRLRQDVKLKDYMFFVVASEVIDTKPGDLK